MTDRIDVDGVDLTPYLRSIKMEPETTTVRYTPFRYSGWRRLWRRLTLRSVESPTFEFEATISQNQELLRGDCFDDVSGFNYSLRPVGAIRRVDP